ncbi:MAG: YfhO family protein [Candidatus Hydrogenedentes bacterium]|nr:YfhO family protein [Candidatus Hydrogenedentota bacterium]
MLALTAALVHSFYWRNPAWWKIAGGYDHWHYFAPLAHFMNCTMRQGEIPWWNPLILCGTPVAGNPQAGLFYPFAAVRGLLTLHPSPLNAHLGLFALTGLHLLLAGTGAFCLARSYRLSRAAAFVAAFVFMFNSALTRRIPEHHHIVAVAAWFPWILLLVKQALDAPGARPRHVNALGAGLLFGVSVLAGYPDNSVYMAVAVAAFAVLHALLGREDDRRPGIRALAAGAGRAAGLLIVTGAVAAATALPLLVSGAELTAYSGRLKGEGTASYRLQLLEQAQDGLPAYHSARNLLESQILFFGPHVTIREMRGAGILALVLALAAFFRPRRRGLFVHLGVFLVLADCSLGPPLPVSGLVRSLCPYQMGWPFRANLLVALPFGLLAAFGLDALTASPRRATGRMAYSAALAAAGLACLGVLGRWLVTQGTLDVSWAVLAVPAAGTALMVAVIWMPRRVGRWAWLAGALVAVEAMLWTPAFQEQFLSRPGMRCEQAAALAPEAGRDEPGLAAGYARGSDADCNLAMYGLAPVMNGYEPIHIARAFEAICKPGAEDHLQRVIFDGEATAAQQRGNLFLKRRFWLARQYVAGPLPPKHALFPAATTVYLEDAGALQVPRVDAAPNRAVSDCAQNTPVPVPGGAGVSVHATGAGEAVAIELAPFDLPPYHSAVEVRYEATGRGLVEAHLRDTATGVTAQGACFGFAPGTGPASAEFALPDFSGVVCRFVVHFEEPAGAFRLLDCVLRSDPADENARIRVVACTANRAEVEIGDLPGPRVLLFVDALYPGWQATVDGRPAPMLRANDAFKAVELPAGTHRVVFAYRPRGGGLALAIAALTAAAVAWFMACSSAGTRGRGALTEPSSTGATPL